MSDEKLQSELRGFQVAQQQLQMVSTQKLQTNMRIKETENAIEELRTSKADTDVYKAVGRILVKADLSRLKTDLEADKETLDVRMKSLTKQESQLKTKLTDLQKTLESKLRAKGSQ
ncbi:MAG: prefoldin subunit beta [archaeon]